jgi:hypothetical protein
MQNPMIFLQFEAKDGFAWTPVPHAWVGRASAHFALTSWIIQAHLFEDRENTSWKKNKDKGRTRV